MPYLFLALGLGLGAGAAATRPQETKKVLDVLAATGAERVILMAAVIALPSGLVKTVLSEFAQA